MWTEDGWSVSRVIQACGRRMVGQLVEWFRRVGETGLNFPPRGHSDDDDLNSSESEALDAYTQPWPDEDERYEESNLQDISNGNRRRQPTTGNQQTTKESYLGKRVWFFRNGDIHYKPKQILINSRIYQSLEHLLVGLSQIVETSTGVKFVFSWPEGKEVKSLSEFQNGKYYVCSSTRQLQRVDYGNSREGPWRLGKIDRNENFLFQKNGKVQSPLRRPRVLTIISNMYRDSREKLILNTNSQMNFEDILTDIVNMVNIPNPPVRALYTERRPHQQVRMMGREEEREGGKSKERNSVQDGKKSGGVLKKKNSERMNRIGGGLKGVGHGSGEKC
ncbi:serine/threonine-protein kinase DCLK2 [Elysia marginata]|uniref:Serine/threonine-protein kinase DCLK2 n=1 Tax=Elysia marginata TaxID=1093978 RepID=A0AAV4F3K0_9GAST|nr:serine/threonine-protein kinase DCLK2 [Elysia marginata]